MKKLLIAALVAASLQGCALLVPTDPDTMQAVRTVYGIPNTVEGNQRAKALWMDANREAMAQGFSNGVNRSLSQPLRIRTYTSKTRFRDGRVLRSRTKVRSGWGGTRIETTYR